MGNVETPTGNNVIVLEQKPIITYDLVEQKGKEVAERIASLDLESIEATEENLKILKSTRSELNNEFKVFEDQRKMVKELVMKPYNDFDEAYKKHISTLFKDADLQLKEKVSVIDGGILSAKVDGLKEYFTEVNTYDFVSFEDMDLKIIKSASDKKLKEEIDSYLSNVESNLAMIETLDNRDRIMAKYQLHKDVNRAISEAQVEIKQEADLKAKKEAEAEAEKQKKEAQEQINQEVEDHQEAPVADPEQKYKATFTVVGTREQLAKLKKFMKDEEISYE